MELRQLETFVAVATEGSFTGAAIELMTAQSNVSAQIKQLESDLGVPLFVRGRKGAAITEFGTAVLLRVRRIERELESIRTDISALLGLEVGEATFGIVGTASRWVVPQLVVDLRERAAGIKLMVREAASERLISDVATGVLAQAIVTEPVDNPRVHSETLLSENLVAVVPASVSLPAKAVSLAKILELGLVLPPKENPLRREVESAAQAQGLEVRVTVEVEGIRLIADLVAAGAGASIMPETALPADLADVKMRAIVGMPPRHLALINNRDDSLSVADAAVRLAILDLVGAQTASSRRRTPAR